jgi:hypothetical protein
MSFLAPTWDATNSHYVIEPTDALRVSSRVGICRNVTGSTVFKDDDAVHDVTSEMIHDLIDEGANNKWFSKLPSHEQLMKRVKHTFISLATDDNNAAILNVVLMTSKTLTIVWTPIIVENTVPQIDFEDSDGMDSEEEPEVEDSSLPPVALKSSVEQTQENYLLTRLRAARARVEAEQIKMQYFETTGRMPPDSEEDEDDE